MNGDDGLTTFAVTTGIRLNLVNKQLGQNEGLFGQLIQSTMDDPFWTYGFIAAPNWVQKARAFFSNNLAQKGKQFTHACPVGHRICSVVEHALVVFDWILRMDAGESTTASCMGTQVVDIPRLQERQNCQTHLGNGPNAEKRSFLKLQIAVGSQVQREAHASIIQFLGDRSTAYRMGGSSSSPWIDSGPLPC